MEGLRGLTKIHVMNVGDRLDLFRVKRLMNTFNARQEIPPLLSIEESALIIDVSDYDNHKGAGMVFWLDLESDGKLYAYCVVNKEYHKSKLYPCLCPTSTGDVLALFLMEKPFYKGTANMYQQIKNNPNHFCTGNSPKQENLKDDKE